MGEYLEDVWVFLHELAGGEGIDARVRGPPGEELQGDEGASLHGGDEIVEAEDEGEAAVVEGEEIEFGVAGAGLEAGLGCVGGFLEAGLDCGGEGTAWKWRVGSGVESV